MAAQGSSAFAGAPDAITPHELESPLWAAANILPLFFKGIFHVWDEEHAAAVVRCGEDFADATNKNVGEFYAPRSVVRLAVIATEGFTLNIAHYVFSSFGADIFPPSKAVQASQKAFARCRVAEKELRRMMKEGGWVS